MNDNAVTVRSTLASIFAIVMLREFGWISAVVALVSVYVIMVVLKRTSLRREDINANQNY